MKRETQRSIGKIAITGGGWRGFGQTRNYIPGQAELAVALCRQEIELGVGTYQYIGTGKIRTAGEVKTDKR